MNHHRKYLPLVLSMAGPFIITGCVRTAGVERMPAPALSHVTPARIGNDGTSTVTLHGTGLFEVVSGSGFTGDLSAGVCGVMLTDTLVIGLDSTVRLASGQSAVIRQGESLVGRVPAFDTTGTGSVNVTLPDGQSATLEGAVECFDPAPVVTGFALQADDTVAGQETGFTWAVMSPAGSELSCTFNPGDRSADIAVADCSEPGAASHTYPHPGDFTASLHAVDSEGRSATAELSVTAADPGGPTASFTASPDSGVSPLTVVFDATDSRDPLGIVTSHEWDFDDSGTDSGADAEHTFTRGSHTVTLSVTNDRGMTGTTTRTIHVDNGRQQPNPRAWSWTRTPPCRSHFQPRIRTATPSPFG